VACGGVYTKTSWVHLILTGIGSLYTMHYSLYMNLRTLINFLLKEKGNRSPSYKIGKLSLCFKLEPRHEGVLGEWRYSSTHSLTSALNGGEWSASRPGRFTPRETAPGAHWIGGFVGPRAVLDAMVKGKIPSPRRELSPRTPIVLH
jgi:hypothetical protein